MVRKRNEDQKGDCMDNSKKRKKWIGWIYAMVLLAVALIGVAYCVKLNSNSNAAGSPEYYAVEENDNDSLVVNTDKADADSPDITDGDLIVDLGDISTDVPLGDATGE